jgi:LPS-assembly lipoprotein
VLFGMVGMTLAGCGFQPLYAVSETGESASSHLAQVEIRPIKERLGQVVFNSLIDEITPLGNPAAPAYALEVTLEEAREGLGFEDDDTVTRFNYTLVGDYRLIDLETGQVVLKSSNRSIAAYNVVDNQFATLTARQDAQARAAKDLSQSVKLHLALFFVQNN